MVNKIQPIILKVIRGIIEERKSKNVVPALAIEQEVLSRITRISLLALEEMENDNVIGSHPNLNKQKLYYITDRQSEALNKYLAKKGGES